MTHAPRVAVVGHVEVVEFVRVAHTPRPGEIVHARTSFEEPAGGGAVAAVQLARLAGACTFFTALGDDARGRAVPERLAREGVRVETAWRAAPQRRGITLLDDDAERTIVILGARHQPEAADTLPWEALASMDTVYFTAGDVEALRHARRARVLVATMRVHATLAAAGVQLDAVVRSAADASEPDPATVAMPPPGLVASTEGALGGAWSSADGARGRWEAAPLPGPAVDAYGCGDSFAAGLTFGLGAGLSHDEALALGARCGAACLTGAGPYAAQVRDPLAR